MSATQALLKASYHDGLRLIGFTKQIRTSKNDFSGKRSVKQTDLDHLFSPAVWYTQKKRSGHRKLIHKITKIVIEYGDHKKKIDPGAAQSIYDAVQKHLNILGNDIFGYKRNNWKTEPDYAASEARLV